jgi:hypothetical protein
VSPPIAVALAVLLVAGAATAADKPCTRADAANTQKALDRVANWAQMYSTWQEFGHCDADATADQYTDTLLRLIIDWKNVDAFANAVGKDAKFKQFVHARLLSPAAKDDLQDVYSRARSKCPAGLDAFCAELAEVTKKK